MVEHCLRIGLCQLDRLRILASRLLESASRLAQIAFSPNNHLLALVHLLKRRGLRPSRIRNLPPFARRTRLPYPNSLL